MVVLDWNLPIMSGGDVLKAIRRDARTKDLRVIVLSGLSGTDGGELDLARSYGVTCWLVKSSTTPAALVETIALTVPPSQVAS